MITQIGMKERDIASLGNCAICGKPLLPGGISFYEVTIRRAVFDWAALQRRAGLAMVLGGSPSAHSIAQCMGPDEDLAIIIDGPAKTAVHEECAGEIGHLLMLMPTDSARRAHEDEA